MKDRIKVLSIAIPIIMKLLPILIKYGKIIYQNCKEAYEEYKDGTLKEQIEKALTEGYYNE